MAWHQGPAYRQDLRDRMLNAGGSIAQVASRFAVSKSYVARARARWPDRQGTSAWVQQALVPVLQPGDLVAMDKLVREVETHPDAAQAARGRGGIRLFLRRVLRDQIPVGAAPVGIEIDVQEELALFRHVLQETRPVFR